MNRFIHSLLFCTLILYACSTSSPATDTVPLDPATSPLAEAEFTPSLPSPQIVQTLQTPHIDPTPNGNEVILTPTYEGCGYQWAYKDMPELNEPFDEAIKIINTDAKAWATAFGEDCVYADGHTDFSAMETDFYVHLPVADLSNF